MKQIDVIRISVRLLETNGPHAILALPAKKRELDRLLADQGYVRQVHVDYLERARRMKAIDQQIAELEKSIEKSEETINGYQHRLPHLREDAAESRSHRATREHHISALSAFSLSKNRSTCVDVCLYMTRTHSCQRIGRNIMYDEYRYPAFLRVIITAELPVIIVNGSVFGEYSIRQNAAEHGLDFNPPRSLFGDPQISRTL